MATVLTSERVQGENKHSSEIVGQGPKISRSAEFENNRKPPENSPAFSLVTRTAEERSVLETLAARYPNLEISLYIIPKGKENLQPHLIKLNAANINTLKDNELKIDGRVVKMDMQGIPAEDLKKDAAGDIIDLTTGKLSLNKILGEKAIAAINPNGLEPIVIGGVASLQEIGKANGVPVTSLSPEACGQKAQELKLTNSADPRAICEAVKPIVDGMKSAATLFGKNPLEVVKSIELVDESTANAQPGEDKIAVYLPLLSRNDCGKMCTGFHETAHILDATFDKISLDPRFKVLFKDLSEQFKKEDEESFLKKICEKNFIDPEHGGHAFDSNSEFFASLMTSTFAIPNDEWRSNLAKLSKENLQHYTRSLETLGQILAGRNLPQGATILEELNKKIAVIKEHVV